MSGAGITIIGFISWANPVQVRQEKKGEQVPSSLSVLFSCCALTSCSALQLSSVQHGKKVPAMVTSNNITASHFFMHAKVGQLFLLDTIFAIALEMVSNKKASLFSEGFKA
jgi:hypothetical protein